MNKSLLYLIIVVTFIMCMSIESCHGDDKKTTIPGLLLQIWTLESFGKIGQEQPLIPDTEITIQFDEEKKVGGSSGCNQYFGSYETKEDGTLTFGALAMTEMACLSPEGVMDQEQQYLEALSEVSTYDVEQKRLRLFYDEGQSVLDYTIK